MNQSKCSSYSVRLNSNLIERWTIDVTTTVCSVARRPLEIQLPRSYTNRGERNLIKGKSVRTSLYFGQTLVYRWHHLHLLSLMRCARPKQMVLLFCSGASFPICFYGWPFARRCDFITLIATFFFQLKKRKRVRQSICSCYPFIRLLTQLLFLSLFLSQMVA